MEPLEIIEASAAAGLAAVSITDHDCVEGCIRVIESGIPLRVKFLTGVEISTAPPGNFYHAGSLHILGYDIDVYDEPLNKELALLREARNRRTPLILERLEKLGIHISEDDVKRFAGGSQIGRAHVARAMKELGIVSSIDEAFKIFLGKNGSAYVEKKRIPCDAAIEKIIRADGVPVLAHPGLIETDGCEGLESLVKTLVDMGLMGIECFYPQHTKKQTAFYCQLADRYGLFVTGGTDFHGALNPNVALGRATGDFYVDYELYEKLVNRNRKKPPLLQDVTGQDQ